VGQGVGAVGVVAVDPAQDGLVAAADVFGAGGGVELSGGDEVEGLEAFAGAWVGGVQCGWRKVLQALAPAIQLDPHNGTVRVGAWSGRCSRIAYRYDVNRKLQVSIRLGFKEQLKDNHCISSKPLA